jgi:hypothetical protein
MPSGCQIPDLSWLHCGDGMPTRVPSINPESAELRRLYADLGCVYRREAEALKTNPPQEALRRFNAESEKAAAIIGRITEIERAASN